MNKKVMCLMSGGLERAKKVAKILKIPLFVLDLRKKFKKRIIDYFLEEHKRGVTPNPCVVCNKEIKFGLFLKKTLKPKADYVATGHYARLRQGKLLKARDKERDQSYFLWMLNQRQLKRILFPIGHYKKWEVKTLAKGFKLPVLKPRKSVETCFIPAAVKDFLKKHLKSKPGPVVEKVRHGTKKTDGQHDGLWLYTIGQRKGMGLAGGPYYVLHKDFRRNTLVVTKNEKDLYKKELIIKNVNWISGKEPGLPLRAMIKIRYRHHPALAVVRKNLKPVTYNLRFSRPQRAITPGQSVVFYRGSELLGGGIIC
jgi:tRNA-specific 2-thiouridylase